MHTLSLIYTFSLSPATLLSVLSAAQHFSFCHNNTSPLCDPAPPGCADVPGQRHPEVNSAT